LSGSGVDGGSTATRRRAMAVASGAMRSAAAVPSASAARSIRLVGNRIPASSVSRPAAVANGTTAAARAVIRRSPGNRLNARHR
jgi:hypothetical protein